MIRSTRTWLLLLALVGGLLIAAACGSDNKDNGNGDNATAEPTAMTTEEGGGNGDGGSTDGATTLDDLAAEFSTREMKVTYEFSSSVDGSTGSFVIYWKPPDRWRFDIISDGEDQGSFIQNADGTYICSPEDGGSCFASPLAGSMTLPFLSIFTDPNGIDSFVGSEFAGVDLDTSDVTIAGQDGTCYSGTTADSSGEACFTDDGILLRLHGSDPTSGDFTMEATEVEGSVSDADLEPPYEIIDIPGLQ